MVSASLNCCMLCISTSFQVLRAPESNILGQTLGLNVLILFLTPLMLQTSDLERSDRNCHFKSDNYILILKMPMLEE